MLDFRIVPGVFLDLHGRRWDIPNTQDMHIGCLFLSFVKRFSIYPFSTNFIILGMEGGSFFYASILSLGGLDQESQGVIYP